MHSKATSVIHGAACCGPRAKRVSPSARCNAKARGNSSRAPQQRPTYSRPGVKSHLRNWRKNGSALLNIANGSACRADPSDRFALNSINCVKDGRHYSLQAQGDFRGIALFGSYVYGTPTADSDVDLLVILDTPARPVDRYLRVSRLLRPRPFPLDLLVETPEEIAQAMDRGDAFMREIITQGRVLYERVD